MIGEPEPAVWCPTCNLPSAVRIDMALTAVGQAIGPGAVGFAVVTVALCDDCGWTKQEAGTK